MKMIEAPEVEGPRLDVAPMIDILFVLIIFFLATTTFQAQEREEQIQLPRHGGSSISSKDRPLVINVTKDGTYIVQTKTVDLDYLSVLLKEAFQENAERRVLIRGDAKAFFDQATAALAAASQAGFPSAKIAMDTNPRD
jgi:biopolymer transport protein ExbD